MKKIILGLVGETGSGKDTFCNYIKRKVKKPVFCFRFSDPLSEILKIIFPEVKKEDQQWLGRVLRKKYGNDILAKILERKIKDIKRGLIILNGIRYWEEFEMIKNLNGKVIYITAEPKIRWQRLRKRGEKKDDFSPYKKFLKNEKANTEILIPKIGKRADSKIVNSGSRKDFYKEIGNIIKRINNGFRG